MTKFAVIIKIPDDLEGNYACSEMLVSPSNKEDVRVGSGFYVDPPMKYIKNHLAHALKSQFEKTVLDGEHLIFVSVPCFKLGEILVMDHNDRTIPDGRKPSKWHVEFETFDNIEDAITRAKEVEAKDMEIWNER